MNSGTQLILSYFPNLSEIQISMYIIFDFFIPKPPDYQGITMHR
jgi:hypothetical protein